MRSDDIFKSNNNGQAEDSGLSEDKALSVGEMELVHLAASQSLAAIHLFEALMLTLTEKGLIDAEDIRGIIDDARSACADFGAEAGDKSNQVAGQLAERIVQQLDYVTAAPQAGPQSPNGA